MATSQIPPEAQDPISVLISRLLAGPARPGQAFTLPGMTYGALYDMARRFKACFDTVGENRLPVCIATEDRAVIAAALLAGLSGGPELLIPHTLAPGTLAALYRRTGFTDAICTRDDLLPTGVTAIDPTALEDPAETLETDVAPDPERLWVWLTSAGDADEKPHLWSKTARNLLGEVDGLVNRYDINSGDRILSTLAPVDTFGLIFSLLLPLAATARVAAAHAITAADLAQGVEAISPTILVTDPSHEVALFNGNLAKGSLRLAFSTVTPTRPSAAAKMNGDRGIELVEIYGTPATGSIATRRRTRGETTFTPLDGIAWRVAGGILDVRSPFLSKELPIRDSGWFSVAGRVKADGDNGFTLVEPPMPAPATPPRPATGEDRQPIITFEPSGLRVPLVAGTSLHTLAADNGLDIRADCGGHGSCGKCRVLVNPAENFSPLTDSEIKRLSPEQLAEGARLACQTLALGEGTVTIPDTLAEPSEARGKTNISGTYAVDPTIRRLVLKGDSPDVTAANIPESLMDWLAHKADDSLAATADINALRHLSQFRDSLKEVTLVLHADTGLRRMVAGRQPASLGFAVDLGTTSVAGYLCDLTSGRLLAADACVNPQRRFGEDVISRICRINEKDTYLDQFQRLAAGGVDFILQRCLKQAGASIDAIDEIALCGNTTMQQVFAGLHPHGLGSYPYFPLTLIPPLASAGDLGLSCASTVPVFLMPVVSGFVGGDTMAAILADRPHERDEVTLIVDIGTNGELVLGSRKGLWVTSCATGPALEGAQISCGMRAVSGAIHRMWPDADNGRVTYDVLGEENGIKPMGICGSGIIDAIASMRHLGIILPSGRLDAADERVVRDDQGVGRSYTIVDRQQTATGSDISVTLKDIRQIQLAKGALCVGIEFLMRKAGIEKIDRTVLTGAFGAHFNWENALAIGMFPPAVAQSRVVAKDNLAGVGVVMALLDRKLRAEARGLCRRLRYLELATQTDFAMAFAMATTFPESAA
ncbi:hypothetical protein JCM12296A_16930 [Desulfosarcina cetonica]